MKRKSIPKDYPVRPIPSAELAAYVRTMGKVDIATCGTCGRSWDDAIVTSMTPAPSARCPFEYFH